MQLSHVGSRPAYACANASGILIPSDHSQQWQVVVATWATMLLSGLRNCLDIVATRALNVCILSASASSGARAIPFTAFTSSFRFPPHQSTHLGIPMQGRVR